MSAFTFNDAQKEIIKEYFAGEKFGTYPRVCLIEGGTGVGKTMAAVEIGRQLLEKGLADRIVYAVPTRDLQISVAEEIEKYNANLGTALTGRVLMGQANYISPLRLRRAWERLTDDEKKMITDKNGRVYADVDTLLEEVEKKDGIYEILDLSDAARELLPAVLVCMRSKEKDTDHGLYYRRALERIKSENTDFVIVNHYLLGAMALNSDHFAPVIGEKPAVVIDEAHRFVYAAMTVTGRNAQVSLKETARLVDVFVRDMEDLKKSLKGKRGKACRSFREKLRVLKREYKSVCQFWKADTLLKCVYRAVSKYRDKIEECGAGSGLISVADVDALRKEFPEIAVLLEQMHGFWGVWSTCGLSEDVISGIEDETGIRIDREVLSRAESLSARLKRISEDIYRLLLKRKAFRNRKNHDDYSAVFLSFSPVWAFPSLIAGSYDPYPVTSSLVKMHAPIILCSATILDPKANGKRTYSTFSQFWDLSKAGPVYRADKRGVSAPFVPVVSIKVRSPFVRNAKPCFLINPYAVPDIQERLADDWNGCLPYPPGFASDAGQKKKWLEFNALLLKEMCRRIPDGGILVLTRAYAFLEEFYEWIRNSNDAVVDSRSGDVFFCGKKVLKHTRGSGISRSDFTARREEFKRDGNAIFICTQRGWEGIDVPGKALSGVLITRLPFLPPHDPVVLFLERKGRVHFAAQRTFMMWNLKQGIGRLVRTPNDWGFIGIGDGRAYQKKYWDVVVESLEDLNVELDTADELILAEAAQ